MTISEAAKEWNVSEKTVLDYIGKGYFYNLSIQDNQVILPNIKKPYTKFKNSYNIANICRCITKACDNGYYVNYLILNVDKKTFEYCIKELENKKLIIVLGDNDRYSNHNMMSNNEKRSYLDRICNSKAFEKIFKELNINLMPINIGLINM